MAKTPKLPVISTFVVAGALCLGAATLTVAQIEDRSLRAVGMALADEGFEWAGIETNGLQLTLTGTAPDEATRFRALSVASGVIDGARVIDDMDVARSDPITAPRFSIELLRAGEGITLIGLVPAEMDRLAFLEDIARHAFQAPITDLLQTASFPEPEGWDDAVQFGLDAFQRADKAKISIRADRVGVETLAEDEAARAELERELSGLAPAGTELVLDISAPRPVVTPFLLRATKTDDRTRLGACSAMTEAGQTRILDAARAIGVDEPRCPLALGSPSPAWADVATRALATLGQLPDGTLTLTDLDIRIETGPDAPNFGTLISTLRDGLPEGFDLTATQADATAVEPEAGPAQFTATRSPEGLVQVRGPMGGALARTASVSLARALFGTDTVDADVELRDDLPSGWSPRVLAALDVLSSLHNGAIVVTEGGIEISGVSGDADTSGRIARVLTARLGDDARYEIDVSYDERLDATLALPSPAECVDQLNAVLTERQITFDPGSATIDPGSRDSVDAIAAILRNCQDIPMEVGGFTDSQGREEMNRELSQARAEAVLDALLAQRVPVGALTALGYGEENPIASNETADGREANRRIEFRLLEGEEEDVAADSADDDTAEAETDPAE